MKSFYSSVLICLVFSLVIVFQFLICFVVCLMVFRKFVSYTNTHQKHQTAHGNHFDLVILSFGYGKCFTQNTKLAIFEYKIEIFSAKKKKNREKTHTHRMQRECWNDMWTLFTAKQSKSNQPIMNSKYALECKRPIRINTIYNTIYIFWFLCNSRIFGYRAK